MFCDLGFKLIQLNINYEQQLQTTTKVKKKVDYEKEVSTNSLCTLALRVATNISFYLIFEYWFKICVCYICNVLLLIVFRKFDNI